MAGVAGKGGKGAGCGNGRQGCRGRMCVRQWHESGLARRGGWCGGRGGSILFVMDSLSDVWHPLVMGGFDMGVKFFVKVVLDCFIIAFGAGFEIDMFGGISFATSMAHFLTDEALASATSVRVSGERFA